MLPGKIIGYFKIDFSLLPTESLAFGKAVLGGVDRTSATPTQPLPCAELLHPIPWMICPAAIAK